MPGPEAAYRDPEFRAAIRAMALAVPFNPRDIPNVELRVAVAWELERAADLVFEPYISADHAQVLLARARAYIDRAIALYGAAESAGAGS